MLSDYLVPVKKQPIYMMVTKDIYELPLAVADSAHELSRMVHVDTSSICKCIKRTTKSKYVKVYVDIDEEE